MQIELRNSKLKNFHHWLNNTIPDYLALCEAGSTTAGDPWVEGRSDRDITIVVEHVSKETDEKIQEYLHVAGFDDTYLFLTLPRMYFLTTHSDQDLSMKFRGETLYGEDLVKVKEAPSQEFASTIAKNGLAGMPRKFRTRLLNSDYWSMEHLKDKLYPEFKKLFMYLADLRYSETGQYPRRRKDVAKEFYSEELMRIENAIATINQVTCKELQQSTESAISFLRSIGQES